MFERLVLMTPLLLLVTRASKSRWVINRERFSCERTYYIVISDREGLISKAIFSQSESRDSLWEKMYHIYTNLAGCGGLRPPVLLCEHFCWTQGQFVGHRDIFVGHRDICWTQGHLSDIGTGTNLAIVWALAAVLGKVAT